MSTEIRCVVPAGDLCGEGAVWHPHHQALYWTDINRFLLHRYEPSTNAVQTWIFDEPVTAAMLTTDADTLLLALGSRVGLWQAKTHPAFNTIFALQDWPAFRFNDARIDPRGSAWVGTMRNNVGSHGETVDVEFGGAKLYRIDPDHNITVWKTGIGISNTLAWAPDGTQFFFGDSVANRIGRFAFDAQTGAIADEQMHLGPHERGLPDGSAIDADGYLWNARYSGRCLLRIAPDGSIDRVLEMPTENPTTCTFGGKDHKTLYITSARSADQYSGSLWAFEPEVGGFADNCFRLD